MRSVYLDHTATTPLDPRVFEAMRPFFTDRFGNASSIHRFGREARASLDQARDTIAQLIGARSSEIFFLSGGTEADNTAIKGAASHLTKTGRRHIVTSAAEHHAVLESVEWMRGSGFSVTHVGVDGSGMVQPEAVLAALRPDTGLISIMHANNEVGTINPLGAISDVASERGILFHSDAVQSFGRLPIDPAILRADMLAFTAHKIYGPKGIGALYLRQGTMLERFLHGGGQERGRRAGTENVALAVGFAEAARLMFHTAIDENARLRQLKESLRSELQSRIPGIVVNGHAVHSLDHILNVSFDDRQMEIDSEALLFNLDLEGIAVSSGSACTSGSIEPSHVLLAMGRTAGTAKATVRFSMGRSTTRDDIMYAAAKLEEIVGRIGKSRGTSVSRR